MARKNEGGEEVMKRLVLASLLLFALPVKAADLGVDGEIWPITEPDLLLAIQGELGRAEADGRLARFNEEIAGQSKRALLGPPSLGLSRASRDKSWLYDPAIIVQRDIRTHQGVLIAARGTRVNPLETIAMRTPLLFIDGQDPDQLAWGLGLDGKIILTGGSPKHLMDAHARQMFFDQRGVLTNRFGITALPARVLQDGLKLRVEEIFIERTEATDG
jgi:conjugal transfer pilus assembly protein TraW